MSPTWNLTPGAWDLGPGAWCLMPGVRFQVLGTWCLVPGALAAGIIAFGTWYLVQGTCTRYLVPGIKCKYHRYQVPGGKSEYPEQSDSIAVRIGIYLVVQISMFVRLSDPSWPESVRFTIKHPKICVQSIQVIRCISPGTFCGIDLLYWNIDQRKQRVYRLGGLAS